MTDHKNDPVVMFRTLCEQACKEQDPKKLVALSQKISDLFDRNRNAGPQRVQKEYKKIA